MRTTRQESRLEQLVAGVIQWAHNKGIVAKDNASPQLLKMQEEVTELETEVFLDDIDGITDELGDVLVTCIVQAECHGISIHAALDRALTKISKRTGKVVDGQFVKDEVAHDAG